MKNYSNSVFYGQEQKGSMVWSNDCEVLFEISATVTLVALLTMRVLVTLATRIEFSGWRIAALDFFVFGLP